MYNKMKTHEQYKTLCINTGDIHEGDMNVLRYLSERSNMVFTRDTGFIIKLYKEPDCNVEELAGLSEDTQLLMNQAVVAGFDMVEIDCDAEPLRETPLWS